MKAPVQSTLVVLMYGVVAALAGYASAPHAQRCLVNDVPGKPLTWRFPDDYPKCVGDRMMTAFPQFRR